MMKVKLLVDLTVGRTQLASGQVADFGEDSAKLLIRKGKAVGITDEHKDINSAKDSGGGKRKHGGRKKSSKG